MSKVKLQTSMGDIVIELDAEKAPVTVENFLQYVRDGFYDNTVFHRVIDGFMVQGGGFEPGHEAKTGARADQERGGQRPEERCVHRRDGAHVGSAFGHRAILHQRREQQFPEFPRRQCRRLWLLCVRQCRARAAT